MIFAYSLENQINWLSVDIDCCSGASTSTWTRSRVIPTNPQVLFLSFPLSEEENCSETFPFDLKSQ